MTILSKIIKSKYFILYLIAAVNLLVAYFYVKQPFQNYSDSYIYYDAMKYLQGNETAARSIVFNMLLRAPLMIYLSLFFSYFLGSFAWSMMIINVILAVLAILVFYRLAFEIYKDTRAAALGSIMFFSSYSFFTYGTAFLIDMGGWFFFILSSFLALLYYRNSEQKKYYFLAILSSLVGVFFKESGALGLITLFMLISLSDFPLRRKMKEISFAAALFFIPLIAYHIWFYFNFDLTYFYWYGNDFRVAISEPIAKTGVIYIIYDWLVHTAKVMAWLYSIGWIIFAFGLWQEKKFFDLDRTKILLAMLPASLTFLIWPLIVQRVAFVFVPWLALISGFGLSKIRNKYLIAVILVLYLLLNYWIAYRVA